MTKKDNSHSASLTKIGLISAIIAAIFGAIGGYITASKSADAQIKSAQEAARGEITSAWINAIEPIHFTQTADEKKTNITNTLTPSPPASTVTSSVTSTIPAVYPVGIGFISGEWNPRLIDLSSSAQEGIYAEPGISLKLFNLMVFVPDDLKYSYNAQAEVYANDDGRIGMTKLVSLVPGTVSLGDFIPNNFINGSDQNTWLVRDNWSELTILVYVHKNGDNKVVQLTKTVIRLTNDSRSWFLAPPYASLVDIVYQVNNGERVVADLRTLEKDGILIRPGDRLRILELWYRTLSDDFTKSAYVEAYLSSGSYDATTLLKTQSAIFVHGAHNLITETPLDWVVATGKNKLILTLSRDDQNISSIMLDRYEVPFHTAE